ncbi:serine/threonine-protein kinase haspin isoform X2 [Lathamus discolor]|uniref:serine/threonine-protein kinase haspin isoform X2 n=1 Tax=Lathamus discolor TaxID=678569 RepID=UPI0032B7EFE5
MPVQFRLLRTYSRRGGRLRPVPLPDRWISPPQDRKRFFSSTSAGSSAASASSSALSTHSDDPDFSPPDKRSPQPLGKNKQKKEKKNPPKNQTKTSSGQ